MARSKLKKLFSAKNSSARALGNWFDAMRSPVAIMDVDGEWIVGAKLHGDMCPIELGGETLGWVAGADARAVAAAVAALAAEEEQKIALANEVLEKYREINLLYNLTEKLAQSVDLTQVAGTALAEAERLIHAEAGYIDLREDSGALRRIAEFGTLPQDSTALGERIAQRVLESGKGEIMNAESGETAAFICVPLKAKDRVISVILLAHQATITYSAADSQLLMIVASQVAPSIENALLYEQTLRDGREREEQLKKQIEALKIQIDDSRTAQQVAEITETDYFRALKQKADRLRYGKGE